MWPFTKPVYDPPAAIPAPEEREGPYTDALIRAIQEQSGATASIDADAGNTAALEAAAGVVSRAFASARVTTDGPAVNASLAFPPSLLASIGRALIVHGEAVIVRMGQTTLQASEWTVAGKAYDPDRWRYRVQLAGPDGATGMTLPGRSVAHPRYSFDAATPWRGVGPLGRATAAAALAGAVERRTGEEASARVGYLLPIPAGATDAQVSNLKGDIRKLKGDAAVVETTAAGWGEGRGAAPQADWVPRRVGANYPATAAGIYTASQVSILAACGVPVELVQAADGTGQREAWRRALHGTIEPLGRIVERELSKLAMAPVELDFERLMASDIAGRARAFQSLVGGGMEIEAAAAAAGLLQGE